MVGRINAARSSSAPAATSAEGDCSPEDLSVTAPTESPAKPEIIGPYRPPDFREHAADREFAWHWTATRSGDQVEVRGLIHNRGTSPVQGVTFALSSPGTRVRAQAPGLIRPGEMRPFYFVVAFRGDEGQAQLSIVAVDRAVVAAAIPRGGSTARRCDRPVAPPSPAKQFSDHTQDRFFLLHWSTTNKAGEVEVRGVLENLDGPILRHVTLLISAYSAGGETLKTQQLVLPGTFEKKQTRPFDVTLSVGTEPARVSVAVHSYQFDLQGY